MTSDQDSTTFKTFSSATAQYFCFVLMPFVLVCNNLIAILSSFKEEMDGWIFEKAVFLLGGTRVSEYFPVIFRFINTEFA